MFYFKSPCIHYKAKMMLHQLFVLLHLLPVINSQFCVQTNRIYCLISLGSYRDCRNFFVSQQSWTYGYLLHLHFPVWEVYFWKHVRFFWRCGSNALLRASGGLGIKRVDKADTGVDDAKTTKNVWAGLSRLGLEMSWKNMVHISSRFMGRITN